MTGSDGAPRPGRFEYREKPIVEAMQVTENNLYDVAEWSGGEVRSKWVPPPWLGRQHYAIEPGYPNELKYYVSVDLHVPGFHDAYIGDYVYRRVDPKWLQAAGFGTMKNEKFTRMFVSERGPE